MRILFLHGWHSAPGCVKPTYLASHGHEIINPGFSTMITPRPSNSLIQNEEGIAQCVSGETGTINLKSMGFLP